MADLKIQGEVVVDARSGQSALDRVGSKAESIAAGLANRRVRPGARLMASATRPTRRAEVHRAEARMRDSIRKSTLELQQFSKTASET